MPDRMTGHVGVPSDLAAGPAPGTVTTVALDGTLRVWLSRGRRRLDVLEGHTGTVFAARPAPDGEHLCSGVAPERKGTR